MSENDRQEGWYSDPYGLHEARWLSGGTPTKLVRDNGVESDDEPPSETPSRVPVRIEEDGDLGNGGDLKRADDVERNYSYDPHAYVEAAEEAFNKLPRQR